jgi:hypothetical protein
MRAGVPLGTVHAWLSRPEVACAIVQNPSRETVERLLVKLEGVPREALAPPQREAVETAGGPGPSALAHYEELVAALSRVAETLERLYRLGEREYREGVRRYLVERARAELEIGGDPQRCFVYFYSACFTPEFARCGLKCARYLLRVMARDKWITDEEYSRIVRLDVEGRVEEFIDEVCRLIERFRRNWEATVEYERQAGFGGRGARVPPPWCEKKRGEQKKGAG